MRTELFNIATDYLLGWKTIYDCAEWIAGIDWEDPGLDPESLKFAGLLELLATEVTEGLRPEADFRQEAANLVAREIGPLYTIQACSIAANSSGDITQWSPELTVMGVQGSQS